MPVTNCRKKHFSSSISQINCYLEVCIIVLSQEKSNTLYNVMRHDYNFMRHDYTVKQHDYNDKRNDYKYSKCNRCYAVCIFKWHKRCVMQRFVAVPPMDPTSVYINPLWSDLWLSCPAGVIITYFLPITKFEKIQRKKINNPNRYIQENNFMSHW